MTGSVSWPPRPVIREMILYARRWPVGRSSSDQMADAFFEVLALLVAEWLDHETPLCLPTAQDPLVADAMRYTAEHLAGVTIGDVCRAVGASERTLRRTFLAVTGMSWRKYLQESRLLEAMALLAGGDDNLLAIAMAVGFDSASAFSRAFGRYAGESPHAYRKRIRSAEFQRVAGHRHRAPGDGPSREGVVALRGGPGPMSKGHQSRGSTRTGTITATVMGRDLSRCRGEHRQHHGVRPRRGASRRCRQLTGGCWCAHGRIRSNARAARSTSGSLSGGPMS